MKRSSIGVSRVYNSKRHGTTPFLAVILLCLESLAVELNQRSIEPKGRVRAFLGLELRKRNKANESYFSSSYQNNVPLSSPNLKSHSKKFEVSMAVSQ